MKACPFRTSIPAVSRLRAGLLGHSRAATPSATVDQGRSLHQGGFGPKGDECSSSARPGARAVRPHRMNSEFQILSACDMTSAAAR